MLLEAAAQVFAREGAAATTNRIATRAGVSIGTLYQYFPHKEALLRALAERHVAAARAHLIRTCTRLRVEQPDFEATVRELLEAVAELHADRSTLHAVMHRLAPRDARDVAALQSLEEELAREIAFHLERCHRGGDEAVITARSIVAAVDAHLHRVMTQHGFELDRLVALVTTLAGPPR